MTPSNTTDLTRGIYRRIYSGFVYGQRINQLSMEAECWFWRILATVDDFGNMQADPAICYNLTVGHRKKIKPPQVRAWLKEMADVNLIVLYQVKGEQFLHIVDFELTQPAGKNGKRLQRHPLASTDESGCIQVNPELSSASDNEDDNDPKDDNDHHKGPPAAAESPPFTGEEFLLTLSDFEQHRREIRHKLTPKAREGLYADLRRWGERKSIVALRESIRNQWRGVFEPKENGNGSYQQNSAQQSSPRSDFEFKPKSKVC